MLKQSLSGAALLLAANVCNADVITQNFAVATQDTNFSEVVTFDLFDTLSSSRILESVTFTLNGMLDGTAQVENLNTAPTNIDATISGHISINTAFNGELVSMMPSATASGLVSGFDGTIDYAGTSGSTFLDLNANDFDQIMLTDAGSLAAYTGTGTSTLDFIAIATSKVNGGGNLISSFVTMAAGNVSVIYTFRDDLSPVGVDEPAFLALVGMGLLGFAAFKRKAK